MPSLRRASPPTLLLYGSSLAKPLLAALLLLFSSNGLSLFNSSLLGATENPPSSIDFNRDIQPIFAEHCLACHGPDTSEAGLDLSDRDSATRILESGSRAINATSPDDSELLRRVLSKDAATRMPPAEHPALSPRVSSYCKDGSLRERPTTRTGPLNLYCALRNQLRR